MNLLFAYVTVIMIWATTPLAIQWSGHLDWFFGIAARLLITAGLAIPLVFWVIKKPFSLHWREVRVYFAASLGMLGGMTPMYFAAQTMPSGWISLIFGLTPILTGVFAFFLLKNFQLSLIKVSGILVSFSGLLVIFLPHLTWHSEKILTGLAFALVGSSFHSLSTVLVKKYNHGIPSSHIVAGTAWISACAYLIFRPEFLWQFPQMDLKALGAIFYLGTVGSLFGFILYYSILKQLDAVKLGLITLVTPVMALLLGHFLNREPLDGMIIAGALLVILGLILFEFGQRLFKRQPLTAV
ncbi:MAG: DMT family transporter [Hydrogenovibrio sp.]|nr:DMT family transporter [Hydrogenovibrio sp.]